MWVSSRTIGADSLLAVLMSPLSTGRLSYASLSSPSSGCAGLTKIQLYQLQRQVADPVLFQWLDDQITVLELLHDLVEEQVSMRRKEEEQQQRQEKHRARRVMVSFSLSCLIWCNSGHTALCFFWCSSVVPFFVTVFPETQCFAWNTAQGEQRGSRSAAESCVIDYSHRCRSRQELPASN